MMLGRPGQDIVTAYADLTLSGGAGAHTDNIFLVPGPIEVISLSGVVGTVLAGGLTAAYFDVYDGNAPTALSINNGVISSLPVGSWIGKTGVAAGTMTISSSAGAVVTEPAADDVMQPFQVTPVPGTTYIRFCHTSAGAASGAIRFRLRYVPQTSQAVRSA